MIPCDKIGYPLKYQSRFRLNRQIAVALSIGASALTTTAAAAISSLGAPPIAINSRDLDLLLQLKPRVRVLLYDRAA
jgi:hypothetical protein